MATAAAAHCQIHEHEHSHRHAGRPALRRATQSRLVTFPACTQVNIESQDALNCLI